jgi:hypothetical protein
MTVGPVDCATPNASAISASANVTSTTADPNPAANNAASASVQASNAAPVITAAGALETTVECHTAYSDPGATAQDSCEGPVAVTASSTVDVNTVGTYAVTYDALDRAGSHAAAVSRTVHVADTTAPAVAMAGPAVMTVECATGFADPGATASDSCAGALPVTVVGAVDTGTPGSYALGYSAVDPSGNAASAMRMVTVADTTAPQMNLAVQTVAMGPPNHKYRTFSIADMVAAVTDGCDATAGVGGVVITRVSSDEAVDGKGDGHTSSDIMIAGDCRSVQLRSERSGGGNGRVYTVVLQVKDAAGNATQKSVQVMVPASGGSDLAVNDGPAYTVNSSCQ